MTAALSELPRVHGRHRNLALAAARRVKAVQLKAAGYTSAQVAKALREQTAEAVTDIRELENSRLDALQLALWDAAMTGDIKAVVAIVKIVKARVHLNGLEVGQGAPRQPSTPRTLVVPPTA